MVYVSHFGYVYLRSHGFYITLRWLRLRWLRYTRFGLHGSVCAFYVYSFVGWIRLVWLVYVLVTHTFRLVPHVLVPGSFCCGLRFILHFTLRLRYVYTFTRLRLHFICGLLRFAVGLLVRSGLLFPTHFCCYVTFTLVYVVCLVTFGYLRFYRTVTLIDFGWLRLICHGCSHPDFTVTVCCYVPFAHVTRLFDFVVYVWIRLRSR